MRNAHKSNTLNQQFDQSDLNHLSNNQKKIVGQNSTTILTENKMGKGDRVHEISLTSSKQHGLKNLPQGTDSKQSQQALNVGSVQKNIITNKTIGMNKGNKSNLVNQLAQQIPINASLDNLNSQQQIANQTSYYFQGQNKGILQNTYNKMVQPKSQSKHVRSNTKFEQYTNNNFGASLIPHHQHSGSSQMIQVNQNSVSQPRSKSNGRSQKYIQKPGMKPNNFYENTHQTSRDMFRQQNSEGSIRPGGNPSELKKIKNVYTK